jgi:hypothetical protein
MLEITLYRAADAFEKFRGEFFVRSSVGSTSPDYNENWEAGIFEMPRNSSSRAGVFESADSFSCIRLSNNSTAGTQGILEDFFDWKIEKKIIDIDVSKSDAILTMIASEEVLRKDWDSPEEDEAWVDL